MSELNRTEHPFGRKDYICVWCGEAIPKGLQHSHYTGIWDGEWQDWRMHDECYTDAEGEDLEDGFILYDHVRPKMNTESGYVAGAGWKNDERSAVH